MQPVQCTPVSQFIQCPSPPSKIPTCQPKSCGRVLTSTENLALLKEKEAAKREKEREKEERKRVRAEKIAAKGLGQNILQQYNAQLLPSSFAYVSNPVLDSSLCRAAAPQLRPLQLLLPADCIDLLQLLLPICIRFSCCSLLASASAAACSIASISTAPRLHLFQLLPDCVRFGCCSSPAVLECPMFSNILRRIRGSVKLKYHG